MADFCCCHVIALSSYKQISLRFFAQICALKRDGNDEDIDLLDILVSPTGIEPVSHA